MDDDHVIWACLNSGIDVIRRVIQPQAKNYSDLMIRIEKFETIGALSRMIELLQWAIDSTSYPLHYYMDWGQQLLERLVGLVEIEGNMEITKNVLKWAAPRGKVPLGIIAPLVETVTQNMSLEMAIESIKSLCWRFRFEPVEYCAHNALLSWITKLKVEGNLDKELENLE